MRADYILSAILVLCGIAHGRNVGTELEWDPKGYVLYCPCSGRFSNQAELLLGSLFFAKTLDRVLVLPPFIDYQHAVGQRKDNLYVPVTEYFDLNALREYYADIVTFEDFMYELAPTHWPLDERVAYCSSKAAEGNNDVCPRKGNPFSTFWEAQNVEFTRSEIWSGDLHYNVEYEPWRVMWTETFPPSEHPVLAFMNAPTSTPLPLEKNYLHKYFKWSADIENEGNTYITDNIERPYVGLHLRNGADWARTCDLADGTMPRLLSSHQCLGVHPTSTTTVHRQLCMQSEELVSEEVRALLEEKETRTIFIATDHVSMQDDLQRDFPDLNVVTMDPERPQLDMYVLGEADHFIGNCISAFTAFVRRHRDDAQLETRYFGMRQTKQNAIHDEF
ncbi:GDP-fucose protein O-fucosyltransferase 1 isoform X2 [Strongylocentrotus purpuratus]|uniref:GDP-fucose protein O-fucosyltransferase 1 n=1 Tax=Strongylocentrotus purpuratus TaxID=7668 RepID=A0A7M7G1L5_STRPU|nr:GDP-fucose protein O-fucosyltransferase 1 isoform X2 [Strongylocentrotus purpuratus]|eukprot:XP_001199864.2 PREDICTED: GDP-fucose protein O-fucosyltransferase 1 isoform X2 [Strongylocentrotus purpuratus]